VWKALIAEAGDTRPVFRFPPITHTGAPAADSSRRRTRRAASPSRARATASVDERSLRSATALASFDVQPRLTSCLARRAMGLRQRSSRSADKKARDVGRRSPPGRRRIPAVKTALARAARKKQAGGPNLTVLKGGRGFWYNPLARGATVVTFPESIAKGRLSTGVENDVDKVVPSLLGPSTGGLSGGSTPYRLPDVCLLMIFRSL